MKSRERPGFPRTRPPTQGQPTRWLVVVVVVVGGGGGGVGGEVVVVVLLLSCSK